MNQQLSHDLLNQLDHRGPDATSFLYEAMSKSFFGFKRLAIQDLSMSASQPFWSGSRKTLLLLNGEIYNTGFLKNKFLKDVNLATSSDTEVLVEMIERFGLVFTLNQVEGMFAIVVHNVKDQVTQIARDYFGVKRLYWTQNGDEFCVASEIRPLLDVVNMINPNEEAIFDWLRFGLLNHNNQTFFEGIHELPAGSFIELAPDGRMKSGDWRNIPQEKSFDGSLDELESELENLMFSIVRDALVSDVEMGILLSGGVDSNLLHFMAKECGYILTPYTIDWEGSEYSELPFVKELSDPANLRIIQGKPALNFGRLKNSLGFYAQPIGSPFVLCTEDIYSAASKEGIKVLFDANGLDELFLGYSKYQQLENMTDPTKHQDGTTSTIPSLIGRALNRKFEERVLLDSINSGNQPIRTPADYDLFIFKLPRALRFSDQASMRFSCELRVPFLNQRLFQFARSIPRSLLISEGKGKIPIRSLLAKRVKSRQHAFASKRALQTPIREIFREEWYQEAVSSIKESPLQDLGWIDMDGFLTNMEKYRDNFDPTRSNANFIWQVLNLAMWSETFFNGHRQ